MKILMTGATGLIGKELGKQLVGEGHEIVVISRQRNSAQSLCPFPCQVIEADIAKQEFTSPLLQDIEAVIHLAGENLAGSRWTKEKKKAIYDSRIKGTQNLLASLSRAQSPVQVLISNSAIGYYGDRGDEILTEDSSAGTGFLSDLCSAWEAPLTQEVRYQDKKCRNLIFRVPMVLSQRGGALEKIRPIFACHLGGNLGDPQHWMSWVHLKDLVEMYKLALRDSRYEGVINAVALEPVENQKFTETLAKVLEVGRGPAVPALALKLALGEMSQVVLFSQRVASPKLEHLNFQFRFPKLLPAIQDCLESYQNGEQSFSSEIYLPAPLETVKSFYSETKNKIEVPESLATDFCLAGGKRKWRQLVSFQKMASGTLMTVEIFYRLSFGIMGKMILAHLIEQKLERFFRTQREICAKIWFRRDASS